MYENKMGQEKCGDKNTEVNEQFMILSKEIRYLYR
jgi:hypothetical protein